MIVEIYWSKWIVSDFILFCFVLFHSIIQVHFVTIYSIQFLYNKPICCTRWKYPTTFILLHPILESKVLKGTLCQNTINGFELYTRENSVWLKIALKWMKHFTKKYIIYYSSNNVSNKYMPWCPMLSIDRIWRMYFKNDKRKTTTQYKTHTVNAFLHN